MRCSSKGRAGGAAHLGAVGVRQHEVQHGQGGGGPHVAGRRGACELGEEVEGSFRDLKAQRSKDNEQGRERQV